MLADSILNKLTDHFIKSVEKNEILNERWPLAVFEG